MKNKKKFLCAIYTRKSSEEGLDQNFNSLDAQRESCEAYIQSQKQEGWACIKEHFDDGGFSGGNLIRPALTNLIDKIKLKLVDVIVVYKVDRLSRSLADFAKLVELFDQHDVSFVSVTQQFNTSTSMGRLTLNVLLSFAQFEREVTGERIRDKIAASKKKGMWMGGNIPLGYVVKDRQLHIHKKEAKSVQQIFNKYLELQSVRALKYWLDQSSLKSKKGKAFSRGALYTLLRNPVYIGKIRHKDLAHNGAHPPILKTSTWKKAQTLLNKNQQKHTNTRTQSNALLSGILFDDNGNAMSPTHTKKGTKRYSYYVSQALLLYKDREAGSLQRLNLQEVDRTITDILTHNDIHEELTNKLLVSLSIISFKRTKEKLRHLLDISSLTKKEQNQRIRQILSRIIITPKNISLYFALSHIAEILEIQNQEHPNHIIKRTIKWRSWGIGQKLVLGNTSHMEINCSSIQSLQSAVVNAFSWNEELQSYRIQSIQELAKRENVTAPYVRRILRLGYLSPSVLSSICQGSIPPEITLEELRHAFPLQWKIQESQFKIIPDTEYRHYFL